MSMPRPESGRKKSKPVRQKHVPIRTCVSCREAGAKRGLIRIVRTPEGDVQIDPTGRKNGRGAYLCYKPACWQRATHTPILNRALNTQLSSESLSTLSEFAAGLPSDEVRDTAADSSEETHE
jgi:predicted RNA-binding protein YlxR (DUF448 family)